MKKFKINTRYGLRPGWYFLIPTLFVYECFDKKHPSWAIQIQWFNFGFGVQFVCTWLEY